MHPSPGQPRTSSASGSPEGSGPAPVSAARAAWLAWGIAASCYLLAIFHRMALGVAALDAEHQLHAGAGAIAALSVAGLLAYVAFQVPAGLTSDRIGPRRGLVLGLAVMAAGEGLFAVSTSVPLSVLGRTLVGAGDAFMFLNVLRITAHWFPRERFVQLTAASAAMGTVGQVIGTVPLSEGLDRLGWTPTLALSSAITVGLLVVVALILRERPPGQPVPARPARAPIVESLRRSWGYASTRDGFWTHLATMAPFVVVTGLWGAPILVDAQGMTRAAASEALLIAVVASGIASIGAGGYVRRRPDRRHWLILRTSVAVVIALALFTLVPPQAMPPALSVACLSVIATGVGAGMIAFDLARRADDHHDGAATSALVNLGGFSAAITGVALVAVLRGVLGASSGLVLLPSLLIALTGTIVLARRPAWRRAPVPGVGLATAAAHRS